MQTYLLIFGLLLGGARNLINGDDSSEEDGVAPYFYFINLLKSTGIIHHQQAPDSHHLKSPYAIPTYFSQPGVQHVRTPSRFPPFVHPNVYPKLKPVNPTLFTVKHHQSSILSPYEVFYNPNHFPGYFAPISPNYAFPGFDRNEESSFKNSDCLRYGKVGSCEYDKSECEKRGGEAHQYCSNIKKRCCLFYHKDCGVTTQGNIIHLENDANPLPTQYKNSCKYTIKKSSNKICGFRFSFDHTTLPGSNGDCKNAAFKISGSPNLEMEPICGSLSGLQYDVLAANVDQLDFELEVANKRFIAYRVTVKQVNCDEPPQILWPLLGQYETVENEGKPITLPTPSTTPTKPTSAQPSTTISPPEPSTTKTPPKPSTTKIPPKPSTTKIPSTTAAPDVPPPVAADDPAIDSPSESKNPEEVAVDEPEKSTDDKLPKCGFSIKFGPIPRTSSVLASNLQLSSDSIESDDDDDSDEDMCAGESCSNDKLRNPLLESDVWAAPNVSGSELYEAAGQFLSLDGRITFGKKAKQFEYPFQIVMYVRGRFHCSGSIISDTAILTAAHCVSRYKNTPSILKLVIGDYNVKSVGDGPNIVGVAKKIIVHEAYSARKLQNDIAIIHLKDKLTFSHRISPVCLPESDLNLEGQLVTVTGWGRNENNQLQSVLMKHTAAVLTNKVCNERWKSRAKGKNLIVKSMLCMDPQDGDSCKGDSGGPCVIEYPKGSKKFTQIGLVSFGSASCTDKKLPGVYTRVGNMLPWIEKNKKLQ